MVNAAVVPELVKAGKSYARDVSALITAGSTTEASYYPAIKAFVAAALAAEALPFDVRVNTSERKPGGGINLPADPLTLAPPARTWRCNDRKGEARAAPSLPRAGDEQGGDRRDLGVSRRTV